ncbi:MAG: PD-(D/E)XK nuclease family protein [Fretibacterium sp.]|nr:PD-(D/E)XK nuclease family protein [Fretibacterium sp.]
MAVQVLSYHRGPGLSALIRRFLPPSEEASQDAGVRFLVPSRKDRDWWLKRSDQDQYGPLNAPPDILWTWQDLYDTLCAAIGVRRRRPLSPPDHLLILRRLLDEALEEAPELVKRWPGLKRAGFLDVLSDDVRELLNEAVRPEQMDMASGGLPSPEGPASELLPGIYRRYLAYLEENGLLDSAQICTAAVELLNRERTPWGRELTLVFTGFLSFTHGQLELVRALVSHCKDTVILKPEAGLSGLYDAAGQLAGYAEQMGPALSPGRAVELPVADPSLEPEAVARNLALWPSGMGALAQAQAFPGFSNIGLMTSRGNSGAMVSALERYAIPFTLEAGTDISQTLPGRILASLHSLRNSGFPTYGTALLLTQPCFAGIAFSTANALKAGPVGLSAWEKYLKAARQDEVSETALRAVRSIAAFCRVLARGARPAELMSAFHKFLTVRGLWLDRMEALPYPDLDETIRTTASAIETVQEKALTLHELLPDIGPIGQTELKGERAFEFLETWCQQSDTRPPLPLCGAVRLYAGQPPVLASHPVWIMLDVTQQTWPGRAAQSPLLGAAERERLDRNGAHLPSVHDKAVQREALFRRLLQTGDSLTVLSRSEVDDGGRPLARSPFIERFCADMGNWELQTLAATPIEILTGGDDCLFPSIDPAPSSPELIPPVIRDPRGGPLGLGASDLKELLSCPMLWWLRRRGRLRERTLELATVADWGTLAHALWQEVWQKFRLAGDAARFPRLVQEEWNTLASGEGRYAPFKRFTGDHRLQRRLENLRFRILRLGAVQGRILDRLYQAGFRHREIWLEEEARLKRGLDGVTFTGQCDRIEVLEDKAGRPYALITDYKEGRVEKYEKGMSLEGCRWNTAGRDKFRFGLQLSAYAVLFEEGHPDLPLAGVNFLGLEDGRLTGTFAPELLEFFAPESSSSPRQLALPMTEREEEAEYAMRCAASLLHAGEFGPSYDSALCRTCGMKGVCRRGDFVGERLHTSGGEASWEDSGEDEPETV